MKKLIYTFALLIAASFIFMACDRDERVTGVTLNKDKLELVVGETQRLIATVLPADATNRSVTWESSDTDVATVDTNGTVTAVTAGTATITVTTTDGGRTANATVTIVDAPAEVGVIINGIRWATRNVDMPGTFAQHPESAGRFFQWGTLNDVTHHWPATGIVTGWNSSDNRAAWTSANDPCPAGWRVPTQAELSNLRNQPNTWVSNWNDTGINGRLFGTAPNQIFLPAAGWRNPTGALSTAGTDGLYWSSTQFGSTSAWSLWFGSGSSGMGGWARAFGLSVRCVAE